MSDFAAPPTQYFDMSSAYVSTEGWYVPGTPYSGPRSLPESKFECCKHCRHLELINHATACRRCQR